MLRKEHKKRQAAANRAYQKLAAQMPAREADPVPNGEPSDPRVGAIVEEMEPALRHAFEDLKKRYVSLHRNDVIARHEMATIVRDVRGGGTKYGDGAVEKLAHALLGSKRKVKSLYRWAHVADAWPTPEAINGVASRQDEFGLPLSWSHLEILAEVEDEREREQLVDLAIVKNLSVRKLRALIDERRGSPREQLSASAPPLAETIATLAEELERMVQNAEHWHEVLVRVGDTPATPEVTKALQNAEERLVRIRDLCSGTITEIGTLSRREACQTTYAIPVAPMPASDWNGHCATA